MQEHVVQPLVSCIMPTADRPTFVRQSIRYFLAQDYAARELIILDDGQQSAEQFVPDDPRIRYVRHTRRRSVGLKRNLACELARGDLVVHWDDDDWYAPWRLSYQIGWLVANDADLCGLSRIFYYAPFRRASWEYVYPPGRPPWVGGNTFCYRRTLWARHPFEDRQVGEDNRFLWTGPERRLVALDDPSFLVAIVHPHNVSPKRIQDLRWRALASKGVRALMGSDTAFYDSLKKPDVRSSKRGITPVRTAGGSKQEV